MLAGTDFAQSISKKKYKKQMPDLKERLACLQKASWDAGLPVIILLEGWETVPKGGLIRSLTEPLDPRGFVFHAFRSPLAPEKARPWMWRFWLKIPERGQWAIFDQSWYRRVFLERNQKKVGERDLRRAFRDINDFERTLSDDGALILKFFVHTEKADFKSVAEAAAAHQSDASSDSAVEPKTLARRYDQLYEIYEDALRHTQTDYAPWIIIPSSDKRTTRHQFLKTIVKALQQQLGMPCKPKQSKVKQADTSKKEPAAEETLPQPAQIPTLTDNPAQLATISDAHDPELSSADENVSQSEPEMLAKPSATTQLSIPGDEEAPEDKVPGVGPASTS